MYNQPGTQVPSSTGGTITYFSWGLRHTAGNGYGGRPPKEEQPSVKDDEDDENAD